MIKKLYGFCVTAFACAGLVAQELQNDTTQLDEVVVSDSRFQLKRANSGKTVIKITAEELRRNQGKTVAQLINSKSGIEIGGSRGRTGEILGVFARGGRGRQVLIVIDGVQASDPSSFSSEYDLRLLDLSNIESIEIIKGAASTLYGPNAATAVINITTKKSSSRKIAASFKTTIGTNQTTENEDYDVSKFDNSAQLSGTLNKFTYFAGITHSYSDGVSAIATPTNNPDDFARLTTDVKLGYKITPNFDVNIYGNYTDIDVEFDDGFSFQDADFELLSQQERIGLSTNLTYKGGSLHFNGAFTNYDSESRSDFPSTLAAKNYIGDLYNKYTFNSKLYTIIGLNVINSEAEFEATETFTIVDPYANIVYVSDFGLNVNTGARLNNHSEYGSNFVFNVNPSFTFSTTSGYFKVLTSYATSYITPSLTQLFGAFGGNPDLEPEENRTYEGGVEYSQHKKLRISALYFNREEENLIGFDENFVGINSENTINAQGFELELNWDLTSDVRLSTNYTFTERKGDNAIRIPRHKVNANFNYDFSKRTSLAVNYQFTGARPDTDFSTFTDIDLSSFSLVNLYFNHQILPKVNGFINITNLFNESFTEVIRVNTLGRNINLGLQINL